MFVVVHRPGLRAQRALVDRAPPIHSGAAQDTRVMRELQCWDQSISLNEHVDVALVEDDPHKAYALEFR